MYFVTSPKEYDLFAGLAMRVASPMLKIRTDNWGFFQEAFGRVRDDPNSDWAKYDCFLYIIATACVTGITWVALALVKVYALTKEWNGFDSKVHIILAHFIGRSFVVIKPSRVCRREWIHLLQDL